MWSVTHAPLAIGDLLARSAREFGSALYLVSDRRSTDAARWLLNLGVGKGARYPGDGRVQQT